MTFFFTFIKVFSVDLCNFLIFYIFRLLLLSWIFSDIFSLFDHFWRPQSQSSFGIFWLRIFFYLQRSTTSYRIWSTKMCVRLCDTKLLCNFICLKFGAFLSLNHDDVRAFPCYQKLFKLIIDSSQHFLDSFKWSIKIMPRRSIFYSQSMMKDERAKISNSPKMIHK